MRRFFQYLKYCFTSGYRHGFGIHSPYVYHLVTTIIEEDLPYYKYSLIEKIRAKMCRTDEKIGVYQPDGSKQLESIRKVVSKYAISPKYGQLLFRLVNYYKPDVVLEYGSTCGISTMYLAAVNSKTSVFSLSAQPEMSDLAQSLFDRISMHNIKKVVCADEEKVFDGVIDKMSQNDFFYINSASADEVLHLARSRMDKFGERFFIVLPCPYASAEMWKTWETLKADNRVKVSINLFQLGILVANNDLQKEDYIVRY